MPLVDIVSTAGPAQMWYNIATPTAAKAARIEPGLPCLVLLVRPLTPSPACRRALAM